MGVFRVAELFRDVVPFTPALSGDELSLELARYYPGAWRRGLE